MPTALSSYADRQLIIFKAQSRRLLRCRLPKQEWVVEHRIEQFCRACNKRHSSMVWYYQQNGEGTAREWLCGLKYLVMEPYDQAPWKTMLL